MKKTMTRRIEIALKSFWVASLLAVLPLANAAVLQHRYSFDGTAGSATITDSVGGADGTLMNGTATATLTGNGQLDLDGNNSSAYVALPAGILPALTNATFQIWVDNYDISSDWAELWALGTNNGSQGITYITLIPNNPTTSKLRLDDHFDAVLDAPESLALSNEVCATVTYNYSAQTASIYVGGRKLVTGSVTLPLYSIPDGDNYLGRSEWYGSGDPYFDGVLDEFRIYSGVETDLQIAIDAAAGPNNILTNPGTVSSLALSAVSTNLYASGASTALTVLANYTSLTGVEVSTVTNTTYVCSPTSVGSVSNATFIPGSAGVCIVTASFGGQSSSLAINVNEQGTNPAVLLHRYSFNGSASSTTITDSVGGANGTLINGTTTAALTGSGQLDLDGNSSSAYVALPSGIMPVLTNATFETWVINQDPKSDWAELWAFGTNNGSQGINYITLVPNNPSTGKLRLDDHHDAVLDATKSLTLSNEVCVTVVYNYLLQSASIYMGGRKLATGTVTLPLYSMPDSNNYLGQSEWYGSGDPYFSGVLDEFRIFSGAESDLRVAIDAAAGPDTVVTDPGALQSLSVVAATTNVDVHGANLPIQVLANFANVTGVDVSTLSQTTLTSSDPAVGTMANGDFVPRNAGVTAITASYDGLSGSVALTVVDTNTWPSLLHRWAFNDAAGSTTFTDSVGSISGTVQGTAVITNGELVTPAGNPAPASSGEPGSGSGWASFPGGEGLITSLPNEASFEIWVVWDGGAVWQEMFDFGQAATEGLSLGGGQYAMICPYDGATGSLRAEWDQTGNDVVLAGPKLPIGVLSQVVWSHDQDRQFDRLFCNGVQVATAANTGLWSSMPDSDNWMARDEWQDPMFAGAYVDFRIWNGALTAGQVAGLYQAGPNVIAGPALRVSASGNQLTLQWPASAANFTLQSTTSLTGGNWTTVTGTPTVVNGLNTLTVSMSQARTYYRLKQ
jgi:hypothetical protein